MLISILLFNRKAQAEDWLTGRPQAYCNTTDKELLSKILPAFDQETLDFYRWQVIIQEARSGRNNPEKIGH